MSDSQKQLNDALDRAAAYEAGKRGVTSAPKDFATVSANEAGKAEYHSRHTSPQGSGGSSNLLRAILYAPFALLGVWLKLLIMTIVFVLPVMLALKYTGVDHKSFGVSEDVFMEYLLGIIVVGFLSTVYIVHFFRSRKRRKK